MRIVANRIITNSELECSRIDETILIDHVKGNLSIQVGRKLLEYDSLFSARPRGRDTEYIFEAFVFNKETFNTIMLQLKRILSEGEFERIKNIFINEL